MQDSSWLEFLQLVFPNESELPLDPALLKQKWLTRNTFSVFDQQIRAQQARIEQLEKSRQTKKLFADQGSQSESLVFSDKAVITENEFITKLETEIDALRAEVTKMPKLEQSVADLKAQLRSAQNQQDQFSFVHELAQQQASRDAEVAELRKALADAQEKSGSTEFLKNLIIQFLSYSVAGDYAKMGTLVPVLQQVLALSDREAADLAAICRRPSLSSLWKQP